MFDLYFQIDIDFLKIIYVLSFFVSSTIFGFVFLKRKQNKNKIFAILSFWLFMYGIKEFSFVFLQTNELIFSYIKQILAVASCFLIFYLFFENLKKISNFYNLEKRKVIFIKFLLLLLFFVSLFYHKELVPLFVFSVGLLGAYYFYLDCKENDDKNHGLSLNNLLAVIFIITLSFLFFGRNTALFENQYYQYVYFGFSSILFYLTSFLLINNFIKDVSFKDGGPFWSSTRKTFFIFFIIFIGGIIFLNSYIIDSKNKYRNKLLVYREAEVDAGVANFNNHSNAYSSFSRIFAQNRLLKDFLSSYYSATSSSLLVENEANNINSPLYKDVDDYIKASGIDILYIMDFDGNAIVSSNRNSDVSFLGKNYSFRPYFQEAIKGADSVYFAKGITSGAKGAYFASPILLNNKIIAVVVAKTSPAIFDDFFASKSDLFLLSPEGVIFASTQKEIEDKSLFDDTCRESVNEDDCIYKEDEIPSLAFELKNNNLYSGVDGYYFLKFKSINVPGWNVGVIEEYSSVEKIIFDIAITSYIITLFFMLLFYLISNYFIDNLLVRLAEKKYKDIFKNTNDYIFTLDEKGRIEFSNEAFKKRFGKNDGFYIKDIMNDKSYIQYQGNIAGIGKNVFNIKIELELFDLSKKKVYLQGEFSIENRNTNQFFLHGIFRDVSEERILKNELSGKNSELKSLLDKAEDDKKNQEIQRLATLNILEDVSETQEQLEKYNEDLKKRGKELGSLAILSSEFASVFETETLVLKVKSYLMENTKTEAITFFLKLNDFREDVFYRSYQKNKFSFNLDNEIIKKISKNINNIDFLSLEKNNAKVQKYKTSKNAHEKYSFKIESELFLDLKVGKKKLGFIHLCSKEKNAFPDDIRSYLDTLTSNFSIALANAQLLNKTQQSKTESLVRSLSNGILMFDLNFNLSLINPAGENFCGISSDGKGLEDFFTKTESYEIKEYVKKALGKGKLTKIEELILEKNKTEYIYQVLITPIHDYKNKIIGSAIIMQDVTHLKYIDKMKTEFVSVASHQLRTPLTAIKLFTEMLINEQVGKMSKEQKEYLSNVYDSTERMVGLVNDLLNVTRIESGRLMINPEPVDLDKFLISLLAEAKPLAAIKKVKINYRAKKNLALIPLDKGLVRQVYHNLLTNAIRYTKNGGKVTVLVKENKDNFIVTVSDSGIGIPKKVQNRIFEKFFRADNAVKVATEGTGLGLYVSKMIIESSGGKIWFKSIKGKGTTFFVSLPKKGMKKKEGERGLSIS
ncbi:MAG: ATP-binding protein [Patescibacteria group bacterium]|jgi:PAS domain S-box-containing protein|nr:ATP-binding protein [Patescibacteria group bacterium]